VQTQEPNPVDARGFAFRTAVTALLPDALVTGSQMDPSRRFNPSMQQFMASSLNLERWSGRLLEYEV
jgi:hypothetical protein